MSARAEMDSLIAKGVAALTPLPDSLEEFYIDIPVADGWVSHSKVIRPKSSDTPRPLIVYFFGGGFSRGNPELLTQPGRDLATEYNAVIVCPNYRLTPEVQWPQPQRDGWDVLVHLSAHPETVGASLDAGFVVGGLSAGANIAGVLLGISIYGPGDTSADAVLADVGTLARPLTGAFLGCGLFVTDAVLSEVATRYHHLFTSRTDTPQDVAVNAAALEQLLERLGVAGDGRKQRSPWFTPIMAMETGETVGALNEFELPRLFFHVGQLDALRDDTKLTQSLLADSSFETRMEVFPEDGHVGYTVLEQETKASEPSVKEATIKGFGWLLGKVTYGERQRGNSQGNLLSYVTGKITGQK